jgi:hypothetical protein
LSLALAEAKGQTVRALRLAGLEVPIQEVLVLEELEVRLAGLELLVAVVVVVVQP